MYRLKITRSVLRKIERLPGNIRQRIRRAIAQLSENPRPPASKQMEGELSEFYWMRLQEYRIIYRIDDDIVQIEIIRVTKRSPLTYEGLN